MYIDPYTRLDLGRELQTDLLRRAERARLRRALKAEILELGRVRGPALRQALRRNRPAVQQEAR